MVLMLKSFPICNFIILRILNNRTEDTKDVTEATLLIVEALCPNGVFLEQLA